MRTFQTYKAWKRAVKVIDTNAVFNGDEDIDSAFSNGYDAEWDGETGTIVDLEALVKADNDYTAQWSKGITLN